MYRFFLLTLRYLHTRSVLFTEHDKRSRLLKNFRFDLLLRKCNNRTTKNTAECYALFTRYLTRYHNDNSPCRSETLYNIILLYKY